MYLDNSSRLSVSGNNLWKECQLAKSHTMQSINQSVSQSVNMCLFILNAVARTQLFTAQGALSSHL